MLHSTPILPHMLPPIVVLITACLTLMVGVFSKRRHLLAGIALGGLTLAMLFVWSEGGSVLLFHGQYAVDHLTRVLHTMILSSMLFVVFFSHLSSYDEPHGAEYYTLMLCSTLGMMVLSSAEHLLVMFVGMELMSLPIVTLVGLPGQRRHIEGALKYFITGGVASCLLLFGCSLIYGATSVLGYNEIAVITETLGGSNMLAYACVFLFSGVAFKLGTAPFHMWVPDVYEGANTPTTMILATAAKVAAVGMMIQAHQKSMVYMINYLHWPRSGAKWQLPRPPPNSQTSTTYFVAVLGLLRIKGVYMMSSVDRARVNEGSLSAPSSVWPKLVRSRWTNSERPRG